MAGLAGNAALAVSTLTGQRALGILRQELPFVLTHGGVAPALGALVVVVAIVALTGTPAIRELRTPVLLGAAVGLLVIAWLIGVRLRVGSLADDEVAWRYYLSCVWLGVAGSVGAAVVTAARCRHGILAGALAGAVVALVSSAGFVAAADVFGGSFGLTDIASELRLIGGVATVIGLPLAALGSVATPFRVGSPGRSSRRGLAVVTMLAAGGTAFVFWFVPTEIGAAHATRIIQNSTVKIANGPLTCADAGQRGADKGLLNNPQRMTV